MELINDGFRRSERVEILPRDNNRDTNIGSEWYLTYSHTCSLSKNWKRYLGTLDYFT